MKTTFQKLHPKIIHYRDYRKYCNYSFRQDLLSILVMENINLSNGLQKFIDLCIKTLDKFAPRKKKYSRGNNMPFMNEKITLMEDETVTTQQEKNAELLNIFFSIAVKNLKIPQFSDTSPLAERLSDPALKAIVKYKKHYSHFHFNEVSIEEVYQEIRKLSTRKSVQSTDIPIRVPKENADIFSEYICRFFNESIKKSTFPSSLKNANVTPVFKKRYRDSKENYRPVSILPVISKIFEKLLCKQITIFIDPLLSKHQ